MELVEHESASAFLAATASFRGTHPVLTNVISTVAAGVAGGRRYDSEHWWSVNDGTEVIGIAMRTAPFNLVLSPMPPEAVDALAARVCQTMPQLPGVSAPHDTGIRFLDGFLGQTHGRARVRMHDHLRVLEALIPAPSVPGGARTTNTGDVPLLTAWMQQFAVDAGVHAFAVEAAVAALLERGYLWEVAGTPVSICGHTIITGEAPSRTVRVGPVFTPTEHRCHGFGAAVTSHVLALLQPQADIVMLYADADNPTSNGVYERLGMRTVAHITEWEIHDDGPMSH